MVKLAEERKKRRRRIIYYPLEEDKEELEEVVPKPIRVRRSNRPYLFPIIGQLIELILELLEARLEMIRGRVQTRRDYSFIPKTMVREVVRDEHGRIVEERYSVYGGTE